MKKIYLIGVLLISLSAGSLFAQDIIVLKNGDEIKTKVLEINDKEVKYKRFDNLDGPIISLVKSEIFMIRYQNGTKEMINTETAPKNVGNSKPSRISDSNPNRFGLYVNPLGFIQFGPMLGMEITSHSHLIIDAHVRFSSAGVLMYEVTRSDEGISPYRITGLGVGGGLKYFYPTRIGGFYSGCLVEYGWQTLYYEKEEPWVWQEEAQYFVFVANFGYKFRFDGGFFLNVGGLLGTAYTFKDNWYYTKNYNDDSSVHDSGPNIKPFGMLELGVGFEF